MIATFVHVFKAEGFLGLYSGLSASLLRQVTYSTTRFGIYEELKSDFNVWFLGRRGRESSRCAERTDAA